MPAHDAPAMSAAAIYRLSEYGSPITTRLVLRMMRADGLVDDDEVPGHIGRRYRKARLAPSIEEGMSNGKA